MWREIIEYKDHVGDYVPLSDSFGEVRKKWYRSKSPKQSATRKMYEVDCSRKISVLDHDIIILINMASKIMWNTSGEDTNDSKYNWRNEYGKSYEMPIPVKEGCEFGGWHNYDSNYPVTLEKMDFIQAEDARALRLYALWKKMA